MAARPRVNGSRAVPHDTADLRRDAVELINAAIWNPGLGRFTVTDDFRGSPTPRPLIPAADGFGPSFDARKNSPVTVQNSAANALPRSPALGPANRQRGHLALVVTLRCLGSFLKAGFASFRSIDPDDADALAIRSEAGHECIAINDALDGRGADHAGDKSGDGWARGHRQYQRSSRRSVAS